MFAKLAGVIVAVGVCACTLLAAHDLAEARLRVRAIDERVALRRAEIGRLVSPEQVRRMAEELGTDVGGFEPILPEQTAWLWLDGPAVAQMQ
ncbi:MAG TPA: hypothetical protein PLU35_13545, partial [Phycisphaerales bacterium]|nr:hypothetical protein [Phycisphaerales bacterium]